MNRNATAKALMVLSAVSLCWWGFSRGSTAHADASTPAPSIDEIQSEPTSLTLPISWFHVPPFKKKDDSVHSVGLPRWIDLEDPHKGLYMPEKNYNGMRFLNYKSPWVLLLPGGKKFLGSMDGKEFALYSYPACKKLKNYPQLPVGGLGACDSSGDLVVFSRGNWRTWYDPQGHAQNVAYCLNLKTGKSCGFALMGTEKNGWKGDPLYWGEDKCLLKIQTERDYDTAQETPVPSGIQGQNQPNHTDWLETRVNLKTLQHEFVSQPKEKLAQSLSEDFLFNERNFYPSVALAPPGVKGVWIGFQTYPDKNTTFIFVDEQLRARKVCVWKGGLSFFDSYSFVPSQGAFAIANDGKVSLLRLPNVPSKTFSYTDPPENLNPAPAPANVKVSAVSINCNYNSQCRGFAVGPDGDFYHIENKTYPGMMAVITRTNPQGFVLNTKEVPKAYYCDITLDGTGNIFTTNGTSVEVFDSKCDLKLEFSNPMIDQKGAQKGMAPIRSVDVDAAGDIYTLTDCIFPDPKAAPQTGTSPKVNYSLVSKFSTKGEMLENWYVGGGGGMVMGGNQIIRVCKDGSFYILSSPKNRLSRYDAKGDLQSELAGYGTWDSELMEPASIAVDTADNVYVEDNKHPSKLRKFDASGHCVGKWDGVKPDPYSYFHMGAVAVDKNGVVWTN